MSDHTPPVVDELSFQGVLMLATVIDGSLHFAPLGTPPPYGPWDPAWTPSEQLGFRPYTLPIHREWVLLDMARQLDELAERWSWYSSVGIKIAARYVRGQASDSLSGGEAANPQNFPVTNDI